MSQRGLMERVDDGFAAPEFREHQKEAIAKVVKGFEDEDKDVMLLDAPTGAGKSLILDAVAEVLDTTDPEHDTNDALKQMVSVNESGSQIPDPLGSGTFFTTPLNSLVDQIEDDEFIGPRTITLKGRNNYECIHPEDSGTPVNEAICQRDSNFECDVKHSCPYYGRKYEALQHPRVVTNMSYLMAEGMIPAEVEGTFADRDLLIVDECQKIEDFAMGFISFTISKRTVPDEVWANIEIPDKYNQSWADDNEDVEDNWDFLTTWLNEEVLAATGEMIQYLEGQPVMNKGQSQDLENLKQFEMRVENFLDDVEDNDWIAQLEFNVRKNKTNEKKIVFKPIEIGRFLKNLLWNRADKILLSSATIPKGDWLEEIGLGDKDVGKVTVPSTFPVENRPIITDQAVGKMTYNEREDNAWPMMKKIIQLAEYHDGKGMIHCRSYSIMEMLKRAAGNNSPTEMLLPHPDEAGMVQQEISPRKWFNENCMMQDRSDREGSLEDWQNSDKQVFFSVAMDEGVSLDHEKCRWQALAKTLYKSMADKRVKYRVQTRNEWDWYNRHAAIQIAQAYGRAVRAPDDWAVFYILDESAVQLIDRNEHLFPDWFLEAVEW